MTAARRPCHSSYRPVVGRDQAAFLAIVPSPRMQGAHLPHQLCPPLRRRRQRRRRRTPGGRAGTGRGARGRRRRRRGARPTLAPSSHPRSRKLRGRARGRAPEAGGLPWLCPRPCPRPRARPPQAPHGSAAGLACQDRRAPLPPRPALARSSPRPHLPSTRALPAGHAEFWPASWPWVGRGRRRARPRPCPGIPPAAHRDPARVALRAAPHHARPSGSGAIHHCPGGERSWPRLRLSATRCRRRRRPRPPWPGLDGVLTRSAHF